MGYQKQVQIHQCLHSPLNIQNDVIGCAHQVETLESQFAARMETLKDTVQSKTAVPTAQVYVSILESNWTDYLQLTEGVLYADLL